jgi:hypothetical protein
VIFSLSLFLCASRVFVIVAYVNRPATLHSFLNVCTGQRPSTVMIVLSVYLTGLTTLNVYCTVLFHFFDSVVCSEIVKNCSPPALLVQ